MGFLARVANAPQDEGPKIQISDLFSQWKSQYQEMKPSDDAPQTRASSQRCIEQLEDHRQLLIDKGFEKIFWKFFMAFYRLNILATYSMRDFTAVVHYCKNALNSLLHASSNLTECDKFQIFLAVKLHASLWELFINDGTMLDALIKISNWIEGEMVVKNWRALDDMDNTERYLEKLFCWRCIEVYRSLGDYDKCYQIFTSKMLHVVNKETVIKKLMLLPSIVVQSNTNAPPRSAGHILFRIKSDRMDDVAGRIIKLLKQGIPADTQLAIEFAIKRKENLLSQHSGSAEEVESSQPRKRSKRQSQLEGSSQEETGSKALPLPVEILQKFDKSLYIEKYYQELTLSNDPILMEFGGKFGEYTDHWLDIISTNASFSFDREQIGITFLISSTEMTLKELIFSVLDHYHEKKIVLPKMRALIEFGFDHGYYTHNHIIFYTTIEELLDEGVDEGHRMWCNLLKLNGPWADYLTEKRRFLQDGVCNENKLMALTNTDDIILNDKLQALLYKLAHQKTDSTSNIIELLNDLPNKLDSLNIFICTVDPTYLPLIKFIINLLKNELIFWITDGNDLFPMLVKQLLFTHIMECQLRSRLLSTTVESQVDGGCLPKFIFNDYLMIDCRLLLPFIHSTTLGPSFVTSIYKWTNSGRKEIILTKKSALFDYLEKCYASRCQLAEKYLTEKCHSREIPSSGVLARVFEPLWNYQIYSSYNLIYFRENAEEPWGEGIDANPNYWTGLPIENANQLLAAQLKAFTEQLIIISSSSMYSTFEFHYLNCLKAHLLNSFTPKLLSTDPSFPFTETLSVHNKEVLDFIYSKRRDKMGGSTKDSELLSSKQPSQPLSDTLDVSNNGTYRWLIDETVRKHWRLGHNLAELDRSLNNCALSSSNQRPGYLSKCLSDGFFSIKAPLFLSMEFVDDAWFWMRLLSLGRLLKFKQINWDEVQEMRLCCQVLFINYQCPRKNRANMKHLPNYWSTDQSMDYLALQTIVAYYWQEITMLTISTLAQGGHWVIPNKEVHKSSKKKNFTLASLHSALMSSTPLLCLKTVAFLFHQLHSLLSKLAQFSHLLKELKSRELLFFVSLTRHPFKVLELKDLGGLLPLLQSSVQMATALRESSENMIQQDDTVQQEKPCMYTFLDSDIECKYSLELLRIYYKCLRVSSSKYLPQFVAQYIHCQGLLSICDTSNFQEIVYKSLSYALKLYPKIILDLSPFFVLLKLSGASLSPTEKYLFDLVDLTVALIALDKKKYEHRPVYLLSKIYYRIYQNAFCGLAPFVGNLSPTQSPVAPTDASFWIGEAFRAVLPIFYIKYQNGVFTFHPHQSPSIKHISPLVRIWKAPNESFGLHYYYLLKYTKYLLNTLLKPFLPQHQELYSQIVAILKPKPNDPHMGNPYSKELLKYCQDLHSFNKGA